ncbi:hypothetical protein CH063_02933 [Colletotrichum higginsianum]|uniref:Uncharacterized protein n=1 Tax=Colletotrichum higginsianum (strain IMI 349063) TaxID=759273 RepID=H1VRH6_COLHI|nr:hypothetical protein CH63R_02598 [Colletotrichum higginsianum IMI 349063]OBR13872.1 hypothetical protein CH63R_02598 [Colletotrichum higginsianum IMI 349063]CCF42832.1 hypothetical protein CH063_02933 [Colletotrichum higginsianum]
MQSSCLYMFIQSARLEHRLLYICFYLPTLGGQCFTLRVGNKRVRASNIDRCTFRLQVCFGHQVFNRSLEGLFHALHDDTPVFFHLNIE